MFTNKLEDLYLWLAWRLPRRLCYWVFIRVFAAGLAARDHMGVTSDDLKCHEALETWNNGKRRR